MERETRGYSECLGVPRGRARAQLHLRQILVDLNIYPINQPQLLLARAQDSFDSDLKLKDPPARETLKNILQTLVSWTEKITRDSARST